MTERRHEGAYRGKKRIFTARDRRYTSTFAVYINSACAGTE